MSRWVRFLVSIAIGVVAGMAYGWLINPVEYVDNAPDSLRFDYKTDYVLMAAEAYRVEVDMGLAVRRLALLGDTPPAEIVAKAIDDAQAIGYEESDLALMRTLAGDLATWNPSQLVPLP